ncbi:MAG: type IX secretion system membrane protein PorP/SprF [Bacteroidota bacterium]
MTYKRKKNTIRAWLFIGFFLIGLFLIHAQREPQYTQYMYNIGSFNPGYVGSVAHPEIVGTYRAQWLDIPGSPRTLRLGTNIPFGNEKHGLGFNAISDQLGPLTQTYVDVAYSYQFPISDNAKLSFGMDVGGGFLDVDFSKGTFENPGEPVLNRSPLNEFYPTVGAGLFLYGEDIWYLGLSVPNFLTDGIYNEDVAAIVEDRIHFNFIGGYVFDLSDNLRFKPTFLVNAVGGAPINVDLSANFLINDRFTAGASYRWDSAISGLVGFQISNSIFIGYSYDYTTNLLGDFNNGSHEVVMKFYLGAGEGNSGDREDRELRKKPKQIDTPRFF